MPAAWVPHDATSAAAINTCFFIIITPTGISVRLRSGFKLFGRY
jgi:hypothetical protein